MSSADHVARTVPPTGNYTTYSNNNTTTTTVTSKITVLPVRLTEDPAGPRLVKVAQNYPDILFFQFVHGRGHLVGKTLGF